MAPTKEKKQHQTNQSLSLPKSILSSKPTALARQTQFPADPKSTKEIDVKKEPPLKKDDNEINTPLLARERVENNQTLPKKMTETDSQITDPASVLVKESKEERPVARITPTKEQ